MGLPIVVYGTLVIDRVRRIERMPMPGEYAEYRDEEWYLGGEAANTAAALCRWRAQIHFISNSAGTGTEGDWLLSQLVRYGIPTEHVDPTPDYVPMCDIYVDARGERTLFGKSWQRIDAPWPPVGPGQWFTADPNHMELARVAMQKAAAREMNIYTLDFVLETDELPSGSIWQSSTDWVGTPGESTTNQRTAREIASKHQSLAILTDGPRGIVVASPDEAVTLPPFPCPNLVDATGAGDIFRAGTLWRLNEGDPLGDALAFGAAAGSLNCMAKGATSGLPSESAAWKFQQQWPDVTAAYKALNDGGIQAVVAGRRPATS